MKNEIDFFISHSKLYLFKYSGKYIELTNLSSLSL